MEKIRGYAFSTVFGHILRRCGFKGHRRFKGRRVWRSDGSVGTSSCG